MIQYSEEAREHLARCCAVIHRAMIEAQRRQYPDSIGNVLDSALLSLDAASQSIKVAIFMARTIECPVAKNQVALTGNDNEKINA